MFNWHRSKYDRGPHFQAKISDKFLFVHFLHRTVCVSLRVSLHLLLMSFSHTCIYQKFRLRMLSKWVVSKLLVWYRLLPVPVIFTIRSIPNSYSTHCRSTAPNSRFIIQASIHRSQFTKFNSHHLPPTFKCLIEPFFIRFQTKPILWVFFKLPKVVKTPRRSSEILEGSK